MLIRLPKRQVALLTLAWAAAAAVVVALLLAGREASLERGRRSTAAFSFIVEQQTAQAMQSIHLTLAAVADARDFRPRLGNHDPAFREMMRRRLKDVPFVRALYILDRDGNIVHDTDYPRTPQVSLADREYFRIHQRGAGVESAISEPLQSRGGTGWFFAVTRRLGGPDAFQGVAVAAVQADYFRKQFEKTGLSGDDVIALFHMSGVLVARQPESDGDVGRSFAQQPLFSEHLPRSLEGNYDTDDGLVPRARMVSYRAVAGTPFVVYVARSRWDVLAQWRRTAVAAAVAMGALTLLLGVFVAYLAREYARQERRRERTTQAEKLEALGQLTSGVAHDFGNVLSVVSVNLALLRQLPPGSPGAGEALAVADRAVRLGKDLIARLMRFATLQPLNVAPMDLEAALAAARDLLAQAAGSRVALSVERGRPLPKVLCDESQLQIALVNLVINARDAMGAGGRIALRVYACADDHGSAVQPGRTAAFVCLAVRDFGPGMTEAVRRRALEPFFTTKGAGGTGLGLSQVYGFMQQLGGSLRVESMPGKGTTVYLFFPVAPPA